VVVISLWQVGLVLAIIAVVMLGGGLKRRGRAEMPDSDKRS
jgi:hypothetical protein